MFKQIMSPASLHSSFLLCLFFLSGLCNAQITGIGAWRDHLPYHHGISVAEGKDEVYCATPFAIFSLNKKDNALSRYTTVNGLSGTGITAIAYDTINDILIVGYESGNIDLLSKGMITNLSDIKRNNTLLGDKSIYRIIPNISDPDDPGGTIAYLCTGFGVVILSLSRNEVKDVFYPEDPHIAVYDIALMGDSIYLATNNGLYAAFSQNAFLSAPQSWYYIQNSTLPGGSFSHLFVFGNQLHAVYDDPAYDQDTLYSRDISGTWVKQSAMPFHEINDVAVSPDGSKIMFGFGFNLRIYDTSWQEIQNTYQYSSGVNPNPIAVIFGDDNLHWIADGQHGLVKNKDAFHSWVFAPDGPADYESYDMGFFDGALWVASGSVTPGGINLWNRDGLFRFKDMEWTSFNYDNTPTLDTVMDLLYLAADPADDQHVWATSQGDGLVEIRNGTVSAVYNAGNSGLSNRQDWAGYLYVSGLDYDNDNNLWIANGMVANGICVRKADGNWKSFNTSSVISVSDYQPGDLLVASNGTIWVLIRQSRGILVFNPGANIDDESDDQVKIIGTGIGKGDLPSSTVYSISEDKDGEIWVGTDKGVAVFYSPSNVFSGDNFDAQQILVQVDGYTEILLGTQVVTAIAVDDANRKWVGTQSGGVFLLSADGTEEIHHFTSENSPLFSDNISSIAIDRESGEVFIGTLKGIISYRSDAGEGKATCSGMKIFPNPVRPEYKGPIAIQALTEGASVKITDIAGNLVFETDANGGMAIWDGRNMSGVIVKSGVYLIYTASSDATQHCVGKLLIVH